MPGPCSFCKALTTRNNPEIKCGRCQSLFHLKCVNLPLTLADLSNDDFSWICKPCRGALNDPPSYVGELLNSIRALQDDMSDIKTKQSDFLESLSFYGGKIDDFSVQLNSFKTVFETVNSLKQELSEVKAECQLLRQEVENLNQYTRINNVEICGVPEVKNENLVAIVKKIGEVCNVGLADGDIDACHRVFRYPAASSSQPTAPKNIIVKFVNRTRKHDLLAAVRKNKLPGLNASLLGFNNENKIFVNDHLSPYNKILLRKCKQFCKTAQYKYCWVADCKIFIKKSDTARAIRVLDENILGKL
ncbi:l1 transposable element-related [Holotrichia oblita]|uniref:L1 transposable element-related n=1 Tax=Holotrichia oblita TaxID=644536 RepID=A0ACB9T8E1_HOLOL|nr:l1 transposable element-related [Holotrichia oblita]